MNPALKSTPGIYLVGFMGSGKSTVGRIVSDRLGWDFVDLDTEIECRSGRPIPAIFEEDGEEAFRRIETEALREQVSLVCSGRPRVVALGGGTFAFEKNREILDGAGLSVWLDADCDLLWSRVSGDANRPLARDRTTFAELLSDRAESYRKAAERVDGSRAPGDVAADIVRMV